MLSLIERRVTKVTVAIQILKLMFFCISSQNHTKSVLQFARNSYTNRKYQNFPNPVNPEDFWHLTKNISGHITSFFPPAPCPDGSTGMSEGKSLTLAGFQNSNLMGIFLYEFSLMNFLSRLCTKKISCFLSTVLLPFPIETANYSTRKPKEVCWSCNYSHNQTTWPHAVPCCCTVWHDHMITYVISTCNPITSLISPSCLPTWLQLKTTCFQCHMALHPAKL